MDKEVEKRYEEAWLDAIHKNFPEHRHHDVASWKERRKLDKEATIEDEVKRLKRIGFRNVDCVYKYWKFGVVVAKK